MDPEVPVVVAPEATMPQYALPGDAGADLSSTAAVELAPGQRALVPTGVRVALPPGHVGLVNPRSGLAARTGLTIVNAPGTIDSGYRGEIKVLLLNTDTRHSVRIRPGDRIAQLVVVPFVRARFVAVTDLDKTQRGESGYGSTGVGAHPQAGPEGPHAPAPRPHDPTREGHDR